MVVVLCCSAARERWLFRGRRIPIEHRCSGLMSADVACRPSGGPTVERSVIIEGLC